MLFNIERQRCPPISTAEMLPNIDSRDAPQYRQQRCSPISGRDALQYRSAKKKNRLHAGAISSSFGSATPISTHSIREATTGTRLGRPHPASRRLLPSLRELIAFPFERTVGRHSRKCQRLFQWRTRHVLRAKGTSELLYLVQSHFVSS